MVRQTNYCERCDRAKINGLTPQPPVPSPQPPRLILASSSPRRRELLAEAGYHSKSCRRLRTSNAASAVKQALPGLVAELAYRKAAAIRKQLQQQPHPSSPSPRPTLILAADTVAECDGFILGKPRDEGRRPRMLTQAQRPRAPRANRRLPLAPQFPSPSGRGPGSARCLRPPRPPQAPGPPRRRHHAFAWIPSPTPNSTNTSPAASGKAKPARSATRTASVGCTSSTAASPTSSASPWNCSPKCSRRKH